MVSLTWVYLRVPIEFMCIRVTSFLKFMCVYVCVCVFKGKSIFALLSKVILLLLLLLLSYFVLVYVFLLSLKPEVFREKGNW